MQDKFDEIIKLLDKAIEINYSSYNPDAISINQGLAYGKLIEAKHWFEICKKMEGENNAN